LIDKLNQGLTSFQSLQELLTKVHNPPPTNASTHEESDFRAQSISDAVALSAAINAAGIGAIIHSINRLAVDLLTQGFFIRGAIVKDDLYHDDKMVFGKALIRAYGLETSVVDYPRVMVAREVVQYIRELDNSVTANRLLRRSEDGPIFLHVLRAVELDMLPFDHGKQKGRVRFDDGRFRGKLLPYIDISEQIQRRFDEATDNPNHFRKVKWFANYWNKTIEEWNIDGFKYVIGPGVEAGDLGFLPKR
jgi:hypothetical protein